MNYYEYCICGTEISVGRLAKGTYHVDGCFVHLVEAGAIRDLLKVRKNDARVYEDGSLAIENTFQ